MTVDTALTHRLKDLIEADWDVSEAAYDLDVTGLNLDSRHVKPGEIFAALPGVKVDGREFIAKAEAAGAVAILAPKGTPTSAPLIGVEDVPAALSKMSAYFYQGQPEMIVAVTGTNGKSSTVEFLRQIWASAGKEAAALGTLGVTRATGRTEVGYTTPDAIRLHQSLSALKAEGVTHLAMEASSHGLKQKRMDGAKVNLGAFTNLTQDHLDYHPDFEDYYQAKFRLFRDLMDHDAPVVINVDGEYGERVAKECEMLGHPVMRVGWRGEGLQIKEITPHNASQSVRYTYQGQEDTLELPLMGEFQAANAIVAAGLALLSGLSARQVFGALAELKGVAGRLELAAQTEEGAPILIDYAHTPDGLDKLLRAARPHTQGKVRVIFGAGGDRDPSKRAKMGAVAAKLADDIIVTDDNPRSEDPAAIRAQVLEGCPDASEIGDRWAAIQEGVARLRAGDCLLIAGKGHETGQIVKGEIIPFDDCEAARKAVAEKGAVA